MPGILKRLFESFRNVIIYSIVYFVVIWLFASYLGFLSSREPFAVFANGLTMALVALWLGFGTEYARMWMKYRKTDFSRVRQALRDFTYAFIIAILAAATLQLVEYLLRVPKVSP
jgi:hypothetical protein